MAVVMNGLVEKYIICGGNQWVIITNHVHFQVEFKKRKKLFYMMKGLCGASSNVFKAFDKM